MAELPRRDIVLFGAGRMGHQILEGLRANGIEPLAFCDNNQKLWGGSIGGISIFSPAEAGSQFGETAVFVVSVWHPSKSGVRHHVEQLHKVGCKMVIAFPQVFLWFPETFLPSGLFQRPATLNKSRKEIDDAAGLFHGWDREEYERQLRLRFAGADRTRSWSPVLSR